MFKNYLKYLEFLEEKLAKFRKSQEPYLFCKKGCALCCKNAQYPYSLTEVKYLLSGFLNLDDKTKAKIEAQLFDVVERKKKFRGKKFRYDCPFLIDDSCSVYEHRGVICRTFGLMTSIENDKVKAPFCCGKGLNYSNVLNLSKNTISTRKFKKLGVNEEPLGFNISYKFLTNPEFEKEFQFLFGEKKSLVEWFMPEEDEKQ